MPLEYTEDGFISLNNRTCYFQNSIPVNMPYWDHFKRLCGRLKPGQAITLTKSFIGDVFNPVLDGSTGRILHSSCTRLKIYCKDNGFDYCDIPSEDSVGIKNSSP